ncbi:MAG: nicotinate-nicotinamide nucleotide adenylyltransferase [Clostridia bacterium]|nr:nicotinate-nicotinamide nucleotide adenylyltransferase [Clostridia bacterium]
MTRIGIFEGTFAPPHNGHVSAIRSFMEQMWLDFVYVIPLLIENETEADTAHRLMMCRLAFGDIEGVYVSDAGGKEPCDTAEILEELSRDDRRLFLLCGTDRMFELGTSHQAEAIFRLSYPVYVRRERDALIDGKIIQKISDYQEKYGKVMRRIVTEPLEISSRAVRERCKNGASVSELVPPMVEKYIGDNHLYV